MTSSINWLALMYAMGCLFVAMSTYQIGAWVIEKREAYKMELLTPYSWGGKVLVSFRFWKCTGGDLTTETK